VNDPLPPPTDTTSDPDTDPDTETATGTDTTEPGCTKDEDCTLYVCDVPNGKCITDCAGDNANCQAGYHCIAENCIADVADGGQCTDNNHCTSGYCANGYCCQGSDPQQCCATSDNCGQKICDTNFICGDCADNPGCLADHPDQPICDKAPGSGDCVECVEHADCQTGTFKLGACTPTNVCTCAMADNTDSCTAGGCDTDAGYVCAKEMPTVNHHACLRKCTPGSDPEFGVTCTDRDLLVGGSTEKVWVPMTTCFAFWKFGDTCSGLTDCNADDNDGGQCHNFSGNWRCTYGCWDGSSNHDWCPAVGADTEGVCDVNICDPTGN